MKFFDWFVLGVNFIIFFLLLNLIIASFGIIGVVNGGIFGILLSSIIIIIPVILGFIKAWKIYQGDQSVNGKVSTFIKLLYSVPVLNLVALFLGIILFLIG